MDTRDQSARLTKAEARAATAEAEREQLRQEMETLKANYRTALDALDVGLDLVVEVNRGGRATPTAVRFAQMIAAVTVEPHAVVEAHIRWALHMTRSGLDS